MKKRIIALALLLCLLLSALVSCSDAVMSVDGEVEVSKYEIEFFMSRMKGTLYGYGYDVTSSAWWGTIMNSDGLTIDEYYTAQVLADVSEYAVAKYLFAAEGLKLTDDETEQIDGIMDAMIKSAGSKNNLNSALSEYGVNVNILKEIYVGEAQMQKLKEHYFGADGLKGEGAEEKKQDYLEEHFVCFKQVFIPSYYYALVSDDNGDTVYYTTEKYEHIAYDSQNGTPREDVYAAGEYEKDKHGDVIYYTDDGRIAYDTEGFTKFELDKEGNKVIKYYSAEQIDELEEYANELAKGEMTPEQFEQLIEKYDAGEYGNTKQYLRAETGYYESLSSVSAYLDEIAAEIRDMDDSECRVVDSGAGFHIIYKYDFDKAPYDDEAHKEVFDGFDGEFVSSLFSEKCKPYLEKIEMDSEARDELPSMREVGVNLIY